MRSAVVRTDQIVIPKIESDLPIAIHCDAEPRFNRFPGAPIPLVLPLCTAGRLEEANERLTVVHLGSDDRYSDLLCTDGAFADVRRARAAAHRVGVQPGIHRSLNRRIDRVVQS